MNEVTTTAPMAKILKKLGDIFQEVEALEKDGYNKDQGYKFTPETTLKASLMPLFKKQRIIFQTEVMNVEEVARGTSSSGNAKTLTRVTLRYRFIDCESGESLEGQYMGDGFDTLDKGIWKGITGAVKYILFELFLIPTNDDPEHDKPVAPKTATELPPKPAAPKPKPSDLICAVTGDTITEAEYEYSMRVYKMPLGRKAQEQTRLAQKSQAQPANKTTN